ncbi:MAG: hypothetical protein IJ711_07740 [Lachnospiraceae bacterium]|nr:hypothetical protein [Lachnospiraceae bacterium]
MQEERSIPEGGIDFFAPKIGNNTKTERKAGSESALFVEREKAEKRSKTAKKEVKRLKKGVKRQNRK